MKYLLGMALLLLAGCNGKVDVREPWTFVAIMTVVIVGACLANYFEGKKKK